MRNGTKGTVVVTGASTGIGAACALRLDKEGFHVLAGVRQAADGDALQHAASDRLIPMRLDVTDATAIATASQIVARAVGDAGLAGLVNNAGIAVTGPLEFLPIDQLRVQLEVNVIGQVAVTQALLPFLRMARGRIVTIGSISGRLAAPFFGPYSASKFALEALTDSLRGELRPWGIHVAIVEPGNIATPIWQKSLAAADTLIAQAPAEALRLYGPAIAGVRRYAANVRGIPADRVAKAVVHALTAQRPRTRYLVGRDARFAALVAHLPDHFRDWLLARMLS